MYAMNDELHDALDGIAMYIDDTDYTNLCYYRDVIANYRAYPHVADLHIALAAYCDAIKTNACATCEPADHENKITALLELIRPFGPDR